MLLCRRQGMKSIKAARDGEDEKSKAINDDLAEFGMCLILLFHYASDDGPCTC